MSEPGAPGTGGQPAGPRALPVGVPRADSPALRQRRFDRIAALGNTLDFIRPISARDQWRGQDPDLYYRWGLAALDCVYLALRAAEFVGSPRTVLDVPCGHGRVTRMLHAAFPRAQITACDSSTHGVEFCARSFGARPVASDDLQDGVARSRRHELIWAGGLLSRTDEPGWDGFLGLVPDHLEPEGVLVVTAFGPRVVEEIRAGESPTPIADPAALLAAYDETGFAYQDQEPPATGIAVARPRWVCAALERHPRLEIVGYTEGGWFGRQDVIVCRRTAAPQGPVGS